MTEKLPDVWSTRDYPVLREVVRLVDDQDRPSAWQLTQNLGMEERQVSRALRALERRGLLTGRHRGDGEILWVQEVSGQAYLLTGLHPDGDDAVSRLVDALRQAAEQSDDPEEKGRLRRLADQAGTVSRDVLGGVLTAVLTGGLGG